MLKEKKVNMNNNIKIKIKNMMGTMSNIKGSKIVSKKKILMKQKKGIKIDMIEESIVRYIVIKSIKAIKEFQEH